MREATLGGELCKAVATPATLPAIRDAVTAETDANANARQSLADAIRRLQDD
jgi:hypothetical protein